MPQRVTLSGSLTRSWRDWPPKEEWPEVATSGQLPASRVVLSAVLPNSLLINLCCLAQSSPSGWVCICAHYSRRIAMPPVGSRLYSKHPQSHMHWPTMAAIPNQFWEPRLKDRCIEPLQFAGCSLSRDMGKGSKFPLVCSLLNCLLPSNRSKNTKHLHNRPMLIVFNSLARKYLLGKGNQNTLKTTIIGGNYPVRNIVCTCTVHCTALCY